MSTEFRRAAGRVTVEAEATTAADDDEEEEGDPVRLAWGAGGGGEGNDRTPGELPEPSIRGQIAAHVDYLTNTARQYDGTFSWRPLRRP